MCTCHGVCVEARGLGGVVFCFYSVGLRDKTQVVSLGSQESLPAEPPSWFQGYLCSFLILYCSSAHPAHLLPIHKVLCAISCTTFIYSI